MDGEAALHAFKFAIHCHAQNARLSKTSDFDCDLSEGLAYRIRECDDYMVISLLDLCHSRTEGYMRVIYF